MIVITTAGKLTIVEASSGSSAYVRGTPEGLQALVDGIEMSGGGSFEDYDYVNRWDDGTWSMIVSKLQLAIWVQFEILNFLQYRELPPEMLDHDHNTGNQA